MSNELGEDQAEVEAESAPEKPAEDSTDHDLLQPDTPDLSPEPASREAPALDGHRAEERQAVEHEEGRQKEVEEEVGEPSGQTPPHESEGVAEADKSYTYFELRVEERPVEKPGRASNPLGQETLSTPRPSQGQAAESQLEPPEPVEVASPKISTEQPDTAANPLEAFADAEKEPMDEEPEPAPEGDLADGDSADEIIGIEADDDSPEGENEGVDESEADGEAEDDEDEIIIPGEEDDDELLRDVLAQLTTRISILGAGGAGNNTIHRLVDLGVEGATVIALNTDAQHLLVTRAPRKILLGRNLTKGLGAGSLPRLGEGAAEESRRLVAKAIEGADIVFLTCGLGGGTGTGATPVLTQVAKEIGALTIAIVTLPFKSEGAIRMANALQGLTRLREVADTVIVIPNDKLLEVVPLLPLNQAFAMADEVLGRAIKCMTDITTKPGLINIDFADLRTIMRSGGVAMVGVGESAAEDRATRAVEEALSSPLLSVDIAGAQGALVYVVGGPDMTLQEAEQVLKVVQGKINKEARIIWGASVDESLEQKLRVMLVVTGVQSPQILGPMHRPEQELENRYGIDFVQ